MNWKKAGYKIGQEVFLVRTGVFSRDTAYQTGTISHVGTKRLVVDCSPKMKLTFIGENECTGYLWGHIYEFYDSEEVYQKKVKKIRERNELIDKVKKHLVNLDDKQLESILEMTGEKENA